MMKRSIVAILLVLSVPAFASSGFYVGANIGYSILKNTKEGIPYLDEHIKVSANNSQLSSPTGISLYNLSLGYEFENGIRTEIMYHHGGSFSVYKTTLISYDRSPRDGEMQLGSYSISRQQALMLNLYYGLYNETALTPYVKTGIGAERSTFTVNPLVASALGYGELPAGYVVSFNYAGGTKTRMVWNVGAGFEYAFTQHLMFGAELSYTDKGTFKTHALINHNNSYFPSVKFKLASTDLTVGLRYLF